MGGGRVVNGGLVVVNWGGGVVVNPGGGLLSIVAGLFLIGGEGLWFNWGGGGVVVQLGQVGGWQKKFPYIDFEQTMRL